MTRPEPVDDLNGVSPSSEPELRLRSIRATARDDRYLTEFERSDGSIVEVEFEISVEEDRVVGALPSPDIFWSGQASETVDETRTIVHALASFHRARLIRR